MDISVFRPRESNVSVTLDEVSASVAFPAGTWGVMAIFNDSDFNAFVVTGSSGVAAALTDTPIPPGGYVLLGKDTGHTHAAAIGPAGANGVRALFRRFGALGRM